MTASTKRIIRNAIINEFDMASARLVLLLCVLVLLSLAAAKVDNPYPTRPYFDPIKASSTLVSTNMILSGFSFAAVILILRSQISGEFKKEPEYELIYNYLPITFLSAFWGFLLSAVIYLLINGETILSPLTVTEEFIGLISFSISLVFLFWGLSMYSELCLPVPASRFTRVLLWCVIGSLSLSMGASAFDPIMIFDQIEKIDPDIPFDVYLKPLAAAFAPIIIGIFIKLFYYDRPKRFLIDKFENFFYLIIIFFSFLVIFIFYIGLSKNADSFRIPINYEALLLLICSVISTTLAISLPIVDAKALNDKGFALYSNGNCKEALKIYDKAIEIDKKNSLVWYNRSEALKDLGRFSDADYAFAEAKKLGYKEHVPSKNPNNSLVQEIAERLKEKTFTLLNNFRNTRKRER